MTNFSNSPIFIAAGEVSGDMLAAELMAEINKKQSTTFIGIGGPKMRHQGLQPIAKDNSLLSAFGLFEAIRFLLRQYFLLRKIIPAIKTNNVKQVILVDNEVFSLIIAKKIRKAFNGSVKTYFFIPPRVSMWGAKGAKNIADCCDGLFCYMEGDKEIYSQYSNHAYYFGNPLAKKLKNYIADPNFFEKHNLNPQKEYISIMPGSRKQEVEKLLPIFLKTAERLHKEFGIEFLMTVAHEGLQQKISKIINKSSIAHVIHIINDSSLELMSHVKIGLVSAGTITNEAVMMKMYPVIAYKISDFTFNLLRCSEKLPDDTLIGLPNVFIGERIFPELLQDQVNPIRLYQEITTIRNFTPEAFDYLMKESQQRLSNALGSPACYHDIAECILSEQING